MMKKIIICEHISLDGFVSGPNGEMDWINVDDELFEFVSRITQSADTGLYGRITWEMMDAYWPSAGDEPTASRHDKEHAQWYNSVLKVVLSRSKKGSEQEKTMFLSDEVENSLKKLKETGNKNIVVFGSATAMQPLMKAGLIDECWLFVNPVLLGKGKPLFQNVNPEKLKFLEAKNFRNGVTGMHYQFGTR